MGATSDGGTAGATLGVNPARIPPHAPSDPLQKDKFALYHKLSLSNKIVNLFFNLI